jgi:hypothetical protein
MVCALAEYAVAITSAAANNVVANFCMLISDSVQGKCFCRKANSTYQPGRAGATSSFCHEDALASARQFRADLRGHFMGYGDRGHEHCRWRHRQGPDFQKRQSSRAVTMDRTRQKIAVALGATDLLMWFQLLFTSVQPLGSFQNV